MIVRLYRKYIPFAFRNLIYEAFLGAFLRLIRNFRVNLKSKSIFLFQSILPKSEKNAIYAFMGRYGLTPYPYKFALEYKNIDVNYLFDHQHELYYVLHQGKKLYFPQGYRTTDIQRIYKNLIIEQDARSPHRYVQSYDELTGKTLLDIGAAEGIFTLTVIECIQYAYLFECDGKWVKALEATFAPWKEKITIVKKLVGNVTNETSITIDDFFSEQQPARLFLKMDIEGCEKAALKGAKNILENAPGFNCSICTYHRKDDARQISAILSDAGLEIKFTEGYLFYKKGLQKGVVRGVRN